jgi:hypothetical protein
MGVSMLTLLDFDKARWMMLPGVQLMVFWRDDIVAVYYVVGPPQFSNMVRTWDVEELLGKRAETGMALTLGEA